MGAALSHPQHTPARESSPAAQRLLGSQNLVPLRRTLAVGHRPDLDLTGVPAASEVGDRNVLGLGFERGMGLDLDVLRKHGRIDDATLERFGHDDQQCTWPVLHDPIVVARYENVGALASSSSTSRTLARKS